MKYANVDAQGDEESKCDNLSSSLNALPEMQIKIFCLMVKEQCSINNTVLKVAMNISESLLFKLVSRKVKETL